MVFSKKWHKKGLAINFVSIKTIIFENVVNFLTATKPALLESICNSSGGKIGDR
jgi:hypothetical protein